MAKISMVAREVKREKVMKRDTAKRAVLKAVIVDADKGFDERMEARDKLNKMDRNGARTRGRNRCAITGRPRGFHRYFKLCRIKLREMASKGELPGVTKGSW